MTSQDRGRIVLITGAAAGIGLATARACAARGDVVVLTDRDGDAVMRAADTLGAPHVGWAMDVTDDAAVSRVVDDMVERFGRIDLLVNNAAIIDVSASPLIDIAADTIRALVSVNVAGAARVAEGVGRVMVGQGCGAIVNLSSGAALIGSPNRASYATSKAAIIGLTRALAANWEPAGVRVNAVLPGFVATEMLHAMRRSGATDFARIASLIPLGRLAEPGEIADAILYLAGARHINGALLVVDGGTTVHGGAGPASSAPAPVRARAPGQVVVVVGGAHGIGAAAADRFASEGACVVVIDPTIADLPGDRHGIVADVTDEPSLLAAFAEVADRFGPVAVLVTTQLSRDRDFERVMAIDLVGMMFATRIAARAMRDAGGGAIITVAATCDGPSDVARASARAAIVTLTRNLACEWAAYGIRINSVLPGGAVGADAVADTIAFLASAGASYVTGAKVVCDAAALLDRQTP